MAQIVIEIPNAQARRAVDALCIYGGYEGEEDDVAARREFARTVVARFIRETTLQVERREAYAAARAAMTVNPITVDEEAGRRCITDAPSPAPPTAIGPLGCAAP